MKNLSERIIKRQHAVVIEMLETLTPVVLEKGRPADRVLAGFFKNRRELGSRDRRFLSEVFFSYFRWLGWIRSLDLSLPEAASFAVHLDQTVVHPALAAEDVPWFPVGDKTLTEKYAAVCKWFPASSRLSLSDLFPTDMNRFAELSEDRMEELFAAFQSRPPSWIRLRDDTFKQVLTDSDIPFSVHHLMPQTVSIPAGRSLGSLGHSGQFEVQDVASQAVCAAAAPQRGGDWWDACAGAGGKALYLADLVGSGGKVFATDVRTEALSNCKKRARTNGIRNIRLQQHNLAEDEPFSKQFDGVLVDAPCSGWGTWGRNPDARWRTDLRDPSQKRNLQIRMLDNAAACVKAGGILVYAVCTFTFQETAEVIESFCEKHADFQKEPFLNPLTGEQADGVLQIWPWDGPGDAIFIAKFRRSNL